MRSKYWSFSYFSTWTQHFNHQQLRPVPTAHRRHAIANRCVCTSKVAILVNSFLFPFLPLSFFEKEAFLYYFLSSRDCYWEEAGLAREQREKKRKRCVRTEVHTNNSNEYRRHYRWPTHSVKHHRLSVLVSFLFTFQFPPERLGLGDRKGVRTKIKRWRIILKKNKKRKIKKT